ncbi:4-hydroxyphenylacetate 3-hydroxylase N-terminal domain-containing protein [Crenobacter sp. SG2303]|uniref:4-hydroxyphenylacetate 3-hydroxylase N-terminal domain-containing protein n=1 Tax=Crenobacter oryzisoli TaxID=3056844 RepID=A0ABT7XQN3_9NEIS|nr:4-hydroxyphenylacetate 3-hydroxylase N-terminal domain-containing protein [Crenobacter sp. SG2303]MDN0076111.1 4-hydroxyphenylacetate 3-hydroxylase N-terminal domain-containing protein [Crenobacter sp. SG2303]
MMRNGAAYLSSLNDGRIVWLGQQKVGNVTSAAAFRNAAQSFAQLYELSHDSASRTALTYLDPASDTRHALSFLIPRSYEELVSKRIAHKTWAEESFGFLGRSPDYMASGIAGFAARPDVFAGGDFDGSANVLSLYRRTAEQNLFVAFTITNPKIDKAKSLAQQGPGNDIGVRTVRETDGGIVVSGAKSIGTAAIFADEIIVGTIEPLSQDDVDYALSFTVTPATPGVILISRDSYEHAARSREDNPLSSRFDENDALLVLDNVFIPWERVLTYRDIQRTFAMWWETPAYTNMAHQASVRFWTKLEFLAGLASLVCDSHGSAGNPQARAQLGRLLGYVQLAKSTVLAAEAGHETKAEDDGVVRLNREITYAQRILAGEIYPKFIHELRMLCGGALIQLPDSLHDLDHPDIGPMLRRFIRSSAQSADERIRLMKLVWDATGSDFASRHAHYEQFYQGAPHVYLAQMTFTGLAEKYGHFASQALAGKNETGGPDNH